MKKNRLGRTELEVTELSYGAMELSFGPNDQYPATDEKAEQVLNAVLDSGINFIDTAPDYGLSEERIGRYIRSRRKEYFLASKCGCSPRDKGGQGGHIWTRSQLLGNIEGSLQRLKTGHVDILQLHNPDFDEAPIDELVQTLQDIRSQKLTRFIGISTTLPHLPKYLKLGVFDTFQIPYSCLQPEHHDAISLVAEAGAGVIIRGGIGKGGPLAQRFPSTLNEVWNKAGLSELCDGMKSAELILRYTLAHPHYQTSIVGTMNPDHLVENLTTLEKGPLPKELYNEVKKRVAQCLVA